MAGLLTFTSPAFIAQRLTFIPSDPWKLADSPSLLMRTVTTCPTDAGKHYLPIKTRQAFVFPRLVMIFLSKRLNTEKNFDHQCKPLHPPGTLSFSPDSRRYKDIRPQGDATKFRTTIFQPCSILFPARTFYFHRVHVWLTDLYGRPQQGGNETISANGGKKIRFRTKPVYLMGYALGKNATVVKIPAFDHSVSA